jgi:hypothetical protein
MVIGRLLALACAGTILAAADPNDDINHDVRAVLTRYLRFTTTELYDLHRGKIVKHSIDTDAPGELPVAGAVRVNVPKKAFLDRVRDIIRFKNSPDVLQIGRFSDPPTLQDLAALTIGKEDFDAANCHVGNCDVRLPADMIRQFERGRPAEYLKQILFDDIVAYVNGAPGRMRQYDDGEKPIRPIEEFNALLNASPAVGVLAPGLPEHLRDFPTNRLDGAEDFLYWSKEKFGVAPFITVTHVTIACQTLHTCLVATKDVYSSRYIDASLALTIASDGLSDPNHFYLVYANRTRADALKGRFTMLRRSIAGRRARASLEENLGSLKNHLEKAR